MELLRGKVKNIRHSIEVSGGKESTSTSHVAVFELDGTMVELKLPDSIIVNEGDEVRVAGSHRRGLFRGLAYQNVTKHVFGKGPAIAYMFGGLFVIVLGFAAATTLVFMGAAFAAAGAYLIYRSRLYSKAYSMVASQ
jgi:hypothetical protein